MISNRADRDALVRGLLVESDLDPDDDVLVVTLRDLHALGQGPVPLPSAGIATALAPGRARRRRLGRHGVAVVALIAVASLGTGLSAAASPGVRSGAQHAIEAIVHAVVPVAPVAPVAAHHTGSAGGTSAVHRASQPSPAPDRASLGGVSAPSSAVTAAARGTEATHGHRLGTTGAVPRHTPTPHIPARARSRVSHGRSAAPTPTTGTRAKPEAGTTGSRGSAVP